MSDRPIIVTDPETTANERAIRRPRNQTSGSPSIVVTLLLIVAFAALLALGYFVWTQNSMLRDANASLEDARERVSQLEGRLSQTEGNLSEADSNSLEWTSKWESEIDKLWQKSYKFDTMFEDQGADITTLELRMKSTDSSLTDMENSITQMARQQRDLSDSINTSNQLTSSLREKLDAHIRKTDDAINAHDQSRLSNSNRLINMDRRIRDLETSEGMASP